MAAKQDKQGFQPGNQAAVKHGAEAAVKAIQHGTEHVGLAREAELAVVAELETVGRAAVVVRNATRLQAAADLYWGAVSKAAQEGDLEALDKYVARYGWLAGCSLRAWAEVKKDDKAAGPNLIDLLGGGEDGAKED